MSSPCELRIDWATHEAAKYACEKWHYSKRMPVNKLQKIGVYENESFVGVIIFGLGASATLHKQFGLKNTEVCELVRVALNKHQTPVTRMIAIAIKFLSRSCPGIRIIVSFADPTEGHHGGIYQGGGWIYTGMREPTLEYFHNGGWRHATDVCKRLTREKIKTLSKRKKQGKYRYIMPLDDEMKKQIALLAKPYPKRDKQAIAGDHPDSGGAAPTITLQN